MTKSSLISVVVPVFNEEKYITNCLNALVKQETKFDYEVIVVNNNSTDGTMKIVEKFIEKYNYVKTIKETTQGITAAKNTGASIARGGVLVFIDADCVVPEGHLDNVGSYLINHPGVDCVGGPYVYNDAGKLIEFFTNTLNYFYWYLKFIKLLSGYEYLPGGNIAIRRKAFRGIKGFNEKILNILLPDDMDFCFRLGKAGSKVVLIRSFKIPSSARRAKKFSIRGFYNRTISHIKLIIRKEWD